MLCYGYWESPLGVLTLAEQEGNLTQLRFGKIPIDGIERETPVLLQTKQALAAYFSGEKAPFAVPLAPEGTPFQKKVWAALREIPYGCTVTYQELANRIGNPRACRAVGMANHRNPIAILIPCHRVVGKNGSLTGYAGGLEQKRALLKLEGLTCF